MKLLMQCDQDKGRVVAQKNQLKVIKDIKGKNNGQIRETRIK